MKIDTTVIETTSGSVRGLDDGRTKSWKGIPYAAPVAGPRRWLAPEPAQPAGGIIDATGYGPVCPQPINAIIDLQPDSVFDEDCLNLNVWTASSVNPGDAKPVMVWVHGGSYIFGASSQRVFDGQSLVSAGDIVLVTLNYRLGPLGFLDLSSYSTPEHPFDSNLALRDVLLALRWVQDNIAEFGGDPDKVTLAGESAGGGIVTTLMTVPAAEGLFARAIAQSSPATSVYDRQRSATVAAQFLAEAGVDPKDIASVRHLATDTIVSAGFTVFRNIPATTPGTIAFTPVVDGDLVPDYPVNRFRAGLAHKVPLLIGTNKDESNVFKMMKSPLLPIQSEEIMHMFREIAAEHPEITLPSEAQVGSAYAGLSTKSKGLGVARDVGFRMPTVWLVEGHSAVAPVYLYRFDWATPMLKLLGIGATHATDVPYLWGNLIAGPKDITFKLGGLRAGKTISAHMQERWLSFVASGTPEGLPGEPEWAPYTAETRATLVIDKQDRLVDDLDGDLRTAWGNEVLSFS